MLSTGFVPAGDTGRIAGVFGARLDEAGFVAVLDAKNRASETSAEGVFVAGSASGPKSLVECSTGASATAGQVHSYLTSAGRRGGAAPRIDESRCVGCDVCTGACPFGATSLIPRPDGAVRPDGLRADALLAVIDAQPLPLLRDLRGALPGAGDRATASMTRRCSARCARSSRGRTIPSSASSVPSAPAPPSRCAGLRRDRYPENVRLVELPCLGRVSALHLIEAVRLGAAGVFLAGCAEGRCHYRSGDGSAAEQVAVARELLAEAGNPVPIEQWHLCAAERHTVGRRLRTFCAHAEKLADDGETGTRLVATGTGGGSS